VLPSVCVVAMRALCSNAPSHVTVMTEASGRAAV
jgi:hypothetical protein